MKIAIFCDTKFLTDGKGNFYTRSNLRKSMLYPIADRCEKLYIVCRIREGDLSDIAVEDVIKHPRIEFLGVPYFRGFLGCLFGKKHILPQVRAAVSNADVCMLRFGSNISHLAIPVVKNMGKPSIGHVIGEFDMEIRENPRHVPFPGLRQIIAHWMLKRNKAAFGACDILCGVTKTIARKYAPPNRQVYQLIDSCLSEQYYFEPRRSESKNIRAVYAGRIIKFKNIQSFLYAVAKLKSEGFNIRTIIIGEGDYKPNLLELVSSLGLKDGVEFTGRIEPRRELWERYRSANIGFLLSFSEGLPLGAVEPMSVGLPLLASRLDYIKDIVTDGVEGFLVDPANVDEIAEKLKILVTRPDIRNKMALAAYEKSKLFSAESQAVKLLQMADRLCKKV